MGSSMSSSVGQTGSEGLGEGRCVHPRSGRDPVSFIDSSSGIHASKGKRRGEGGGEGSGEGEGEGDGAGMGLAARSVSLSLLSRVALWNAGVSVQGSLSLPLVAALP